MHHSEHQYLYNKSWLQDYQRKYQIDKDISRSKLSKLDARHIPKFSGEIRLFAKVRNEALRLPYFLKYYLNKGVDRIFLADNCSTDSTLDIARQFDNVHIFQTQESFTKHWFWIEVLLEEFGRGHWCIVADADEILYYPHAESLNLQQLVHLLEEEKATAMMCLMLDMYANKPIGKAHYKAGQDPQEICHYFDKQYCEDKMPWFSTKAQKMFTSKIFVGGMRERVFGKKPYLISKIPLFKYTDMICLRKDVHAVGNANISSIQGVLFHYKFFSDFLKFCKVQVAREVYYNKSITYKIFNDKLKENPNLNLYCKDSHKFKDSGQLMSLGLMKTGIVRFPESRPFKSNNCIMESANFL